MSARCLAAGTTLVLGLALLAGCTHDDPQPASNPPPSQPAVPTQPETALPADDTLIVAGGSAAELALGTSRALFTHAPAVVLLDAADAADPADAAGVERASTTAVELGVPLLLTDAAEVAAPPSPSGAPGASGAPSASPGTGPGGPAAEALRAELERLDARSLVAVGDHAATWARTAAGDRTVVPLPPSGDDSAPLPPVHPAPPLALLALTIDGAGEAAAANTTAKAAGAKLVGVGADPRGAAGLVGVETGHILAIGGGFGPPDRLRHRVETAATGQQLPGGGQLLFPGRRMVALYGYPGDPGLGVLGEQGLAASVARAQQVAASYTGLDGVPAVPAFEVIATVASSGPGDDGDYSRESSVDFLRPWVDAARAAGIYVMLDLQPGRTDFLTQAQRYAELLAEPNVGLALDPEWRLKPDQKHLEQIGSVTADEVNRTGRWLADLTRENKLPQKILMVHQFRLDMVTDRSTLVTDYDDLAVVIHADGFGSSGQKFNTWNALHLDAPPNVWWGWKNFYDEDKPTFTPQQTVAVSPSPVFVSYQ